MTETLLVSEIFGPTFQGEGPSAGQVAAFVRLSRCNLSCSWCDTPYTWDTRRFDLRTQTRRMDQEQLHRAVLDVPVALVVVTGGEPLLQQEALVRPVDILRAHRRRVEVETSGSITPSESILGAAHRFVVSPKLANSGLPEHRRINPQALTAFAAWGKAVFKFVVEHPGDLDEIAELQTRFGLEPIWIMPEGTASARVLDRMRELADAVLARGWNLTSRLHVLLWEDTRGR